MRIKDKLQSTQTRQLVILTAMFLLAFLPRALYPVSWPMQWYRRSIRFSEAILTGNWSDTFQRHHPGVTTMWLSGFGMKVFAHSRGLTPDQLLGIEPAQPGVTSNAIIAAVRPLAFVIALCIALSYVLIRRLAGSRVAIAAAGLLALNPFYIARSQVLHVDALLATFMMVSVLFLMNHMQSEKHSDLALSGVFGGFALLSKSPALFLVPYTVLVTASWDLLSMMQRSKPQWKGYFKRTLTRIMLWIVTAAVVFVALWPAMWVRPIDTAQKMVENITDKVETPHYNPIYFNGEVTFDDPGPRFYLATLAWRTTAVTLPMLGMSIAFTLWQLRSGNQIEPIPWLLIAYIVFFIAQMSLAARKEMRYILPTFLAVDILAGVSMVKLGKWINKILPRQEKRWTEMALIGGLLMLQAGLILPRHPYYGTLFNHLLGGTEGAQYVLPLQHEEEGLDLAARYLNDLPNAQKVTVGLHKRGDNFFKRYFEGSITTIDDPAADYRIYTINQILRQMDIEDWKTLWELDQETEPVWTVSFGGVTFVWIYESQNLLKVRGPGYATDHRLGEHIWLREVKTSTEVVAPGGQLIVAPTWEISGDVEKSYKVFCHLLSDSQNLIAQRDGFPLNGSRLTSTWREGDFIKDSYVINISDDAPPGQYELSIGMYDPKSMKRLPVYTSTGERLPNARIVLGQIAVQAID